MGVITTAKIPNGSSDSAFRMGRAKAAVLPLPVGAQPITSSPRSAAGRQFACTGVGCFSASDSHCRTTQGARPSEVHGTGASAISACSRPRDGRSLAAVSTCPSPSPMPRNGSEQLAKAKGKGKGQGAIYPDRLDHRAMSAVWPAVRAARRVRRRNRALIAERACRRACVCRRRVCVSPPRRAACWRAGSCAATMVNIRCAATTCRCAGPVLERAARREQLRSPTRQRISPPALAASRRTHACIAAAPRVSAGKRRSTICQPCRPATSCASPRTTT